MIGETSDSKTICETKTLQNGIKVCVSGPASVSEFAIVQVEKIVVIPSMVFTSKKQLEPFLKQMNRIYEEMK